MSIDTNVPRSGFHSELTAAKIELLVASGNAAPEFGDGAVQRFFVLPNSRAVQVVRRGDHICAAVGMLHEDGTFAFRCANSVKDSRELLETFRNEASKMTGSSTSRDVLPERSVMLGLGTGGVLMVLQPVG